MATIVLAAALFVVAAVFVGVGLAGITGRLPRNGIVGIQTESVKRTDARWQAGHRAASTLLLAAAGPPLLLAVALIAVPPSDIADWFIVYAIVGLVTGGLVALAVRQAERATADME